MYDVLGKLLIELRDDADVAAIVDDRVRGGEPAPGDAIGPPYQAFVVLVTLSTPRMMRVPAQMPRIGVNCYGRTAQEAAQLYGACSDAIHDRGPRVYGNGLGIYISHDDSGGAAERDPDTKQPYVSFVIEAIATTQAVVV
jgi:hypothetical protein